MKLLQASTDPSAMTDRSKEGTLDAIPFRDDQRYAVAYLGYEGMKSRPFIPPCNANDIFPDATVALATETETMEFSPCISLADGTVEV